MQSPSKSEKLHLAKKKPTSNSISRKWRLMSISPEGRACHNQSADPTRLFAGRLAKLTHQPLQREAKSSLVTRGWNMENHAQVQIGSKKPRQARTWASRAARRFVNTLVPECDGETAAFRVSVCAREFARGQRRGIQVYLAPRVLAALVFPRSPRCSGYWWACKMKTRSHRSVVYCAKDAKCLQVECRCECWLQRQFHWVSLFDTYGFRVCNVMLVEIFLKWSDSYKGYLFTLYRADKWAFEREYNIYIKLAMHCRWIGNVYSTPESRCLNRAWITSKMYVL